LLKIEYSGGVALVTDVPLPSIGDSSHGIKITSVTLRSHVYTIAYDSVPAEGGEFELYTPLAIDRTEGVRCKNLLSNHYRCSVTPLDKGSNSSYRHGEATVVFANIRSR
jgi:hypothetical protein